MFFGLIQICSSEAEFLQHSVGLPKELSRHFSLQVLMEPYFNLIAVESNMEAISSLTDTYANYKVEKSDKSKSESSLSSG